MKAQQRICSINKCIYFKLETTA